MGAFQVGSVSLGQRGGKGGKVTELSKIFKRSLKPNCKMTVFPPSDIMQQKTCFFFHVTSFLNFAGVISFATTALTIIVAIQRLGAFQELCCGSSHVSGRSWRGIVSDFTEELWIHAVIKLS